MTARQRPGPAVKTKTRQRPGGKRRPDERRRKRPARTRTAVTAGRPAAEQGVRERAGTGPAAAAGAVGPASAPRAPDPAEQAFDLLHARHARGLVRQAYVLCGHRRTAEHAVAYAFRLAWRRWPEVARDPDPAGWVRAAACACAVSPWHRLRPGRRTPEAHAGPPADRALLNGMLRLPASYRHALVLHEGLGLSVADTAAETEASTAATVGRIAHAREVLFNELPELRGAQADRRGALLAGRLRLLTAAQPVRTRPAAPVRGGSERADRRWTRAVAGLAAAAAAAAAAALLPTAERGTPPPHHAGNRAPASPAARASGGAAAGEAYEPQLRSANHRVRFGGPERGRDGGRERDRKGERDRDRKREGTPGRGPATAPAPAPAPEQRQENRKPERTERR